MLLIPAFAGALQIRFPPFCPLAVSSLSYALQRNIMCTMPEYDMALLGKPIEITCEVEFREQLFEVRSLFPTFGSWGSNSFCQAWL